uniref:Uncharacterized protein n=1 Tax=Tanacetum cinerariifolium TaxID=118510 RepID=A0A6L2JA51_TANCI|nr:hypothetical protein [Tanacetum cinerariifolium]
MALPPTLYPLAKEDGYHPHCDIDFEEGCNLKHSFPEIIVTHITVVKTLLRKWMKLLEVKRRSFVKPQHRKTTNSVPSKSEHQVLISKWIQEIMVGTGMALLAFLVDIQES